MPRSQCCHVRGYGDTRQAGYSQGGHTGSTTAGGWNSGEHEIIENNQLNDLRYFKPTWTLNLICVRLFFFTLTLAFTGVLCLCNNQETEGTPPAAGAGVGSVQRSHRIGNMKYRNFNTTAYY